jgi:hypothetical protein
MWYIWSRGLDFGKMLSAVEFIVGAFLEVWLCQNDFRASESTNKELMAFWVGFFYSFFRGKYYCELKKAHG